MADIDIQVATGLEGLDEVEEAFTSGSKRAVKKFLRRVEMKAAKILVKSAEEFAPYESGNLESDIGRQSVQSEGALTVRVGPNSRAFYGLFQELGAPEAHVLALHWLEESAKAVQDKVLEEFYTGLREGLEEMKK
jgi:hypothetical protein